MKKVLSENEVIEAMDFVLENDESTRELVEKAPYVGVMCRYIATKIQEKVGQDEVRGETVMELLSRVEREDKYLSRIVDNNATLFIALGIIVVNVNRHIFRESEDE